MSNYVKPQSPIYNRKTDTYIYPLTTADQIIMPDGSRFTNIGVIQKNYSVVGGLEEPSNPTQNMIWIQTETPIGRVFFSNDELNETFADGDIWIVTGNNSNVAFNALKIDNEYINEVYPLFAKQYVNSTLVDKTAYIYQSEEWMSWWNGTLYDNGEEIVPWTGGWYKNEDKLYGTGSSTTYVYEYTENKHDLTYFNTLNVSATPNIGSGDGYQNLVFGIASAVSKNNVTAVASATFPVWGSLLTISLENLPDGEFYIFLQAPRNVNADAQAFVYKVWLE